MIASLLLASACGTSSTNAHLTPTVSSQPVATASTAATPSDTSTPPGLASLVHCTAPVPSGDTLVIGTVVGDPTVVVRDIQDPAHARNLCTFDPGASSPQFVSASQVAYETAGGQIVESDLAAGGASTTVASFATGFGSGQYATSPDGHSLTYIDGNAWHLLNASGNHVLTSLPAVPGRGTNPDEDDSYLSFSPDGLYLAWFQTFHTGGTGAAAPNQVRRATDGSLVYSTTAVTMAVWSSVPSRLFFRDSSGNMRRWDATSGASSMLALNWIRPRSSPDGRWIAYTTRIPGGLGSVGLYSVQSNSSANVSPPGRSGGRFLNNDLVWYQGERACATCFGGVPTPTGVAYIYDIAGSTEVVSRLSSVLDGWPRSTPPGL